jgi:hypothetical protein
MHTVMAHQETSTFPLSLAILNTELHSPILFLHLQIDKESKQVNGKCELIKTAIKSFKSVKTELIGHYKFLSIMPDDNQHLVTLLGYPAYDQICPTIRIMLITDAKWKKAKVFYEYLENDEWKKVKDVHIKIR